MEKSLLLTASLCLLALVGSSCEKEEETESNLLGRCTGLDERRTVDTFYKAEGTVVYLSEWNLYYLSGGPGSKERYNNLLAPCNLPEEFKKDKLRIVFSGKLKEVYEWEDMAGQYFELTKIEAIK